MRERSMDARSPIPRANSSVVVPKPPGPTSEDRAKPTRRFVGRGLAIGLAIALAASSVPIYRAITTDDARDAALAADSTTLPNAVSGHSEHDHQTQTGQTP